MSSKQITVNQSGHFVPQKEMPSLVYFPCVLVSLSFSYYHHSPKAAMLTPHRRFRVFSFVSGLRSEYPRKREITVFLTPPHLMCEAIIGWTVDQSYCVSSVINLHSGWVALRSSVNRLGHCGEFWDVLLEPIERLGRFLVKM